MISVGRDERLIHSHISSAIRSEQLVSLLSLNITSKGSLHLTMPNIDNDYVHSLYRHEHVPSSSSSVTNCYSYETMRKFLTWNKMIKGKSLLGIYSGVLPDPSIQTFHQFARRWIYGNGDDLAQICEVNSNVAEELHRPDLQATWQMIKMLFADHEMSLHSSRNSRSLTKSHRISDPLSSHRRHLHHGKKVISAEKQPTDRRMNEDDQSQEEKLISNPKLGHYDQSAFEYLQRDFCYLDMIDDTDTYIVRDVLTDDLIFLTPDDLPQNSNTDQLLDDLQVNELKRRK